jgi:uncharacterized NAD(P)/FAD-binding protein YdhS
VFQVPTQHAIIIGGGASGVLLAYQLLRDPRSGFRVTLIEQRPEIGRGVAYRTDNPDHLLNVRAANMSALPDAPDHFFRWLSTRSVRNADCSDPFCFVPRGVYGEYLASLVAPFLHSGKESGRLSIVGGQCVTARESPAGVEVTLAHGPRLSGDVAVLATGHETSTNKPDYYADPWSPPSSAGISKNDSVLILGTGLTMVDYVLALLLGGHQGETVAISRRGLLPRPHRHVEAIVIGAADVPFGTSVGQLLRWFRGQIDSHARNGGDWRSVVDGLRPHAQRLWHELPLASKRRFLEHARAWWDVHRHRMAPEVEARISNAIASHRLSLLAAKLVRVEPNATGALVHYRRRGEIDVESMQIAKIVDCTGIVRNPTRFANPVLLSLMEQGLACVDPLHIGIEVGPDCAVISQRGTPSQRLFAVGPLTRAAFWEIIAIPDIRNQCAELATRLIRSQARIDLHQTRRVHLPSAPSRLQ